MKKFVLSVLIALLLTSPVLAFTPKEYVSDRIMAVSWLTNDTVYVAIANNTLSRNTYTIETYEANRRNPVDRQSVVIPSRSVLIEAFPLRANQLRQEWPIQEVVVADRYNSVTITVQYDKYLSVKDYVMRANTNINIDVDLLAITRNTSYGQLLVDDEYSINSGGRGRITIGAFEGGYTVSHGRNRVEYRPPYMQLSMRAPFMQGVGILTFGMMHLIDGPGNNFREYIQGPQIMVYGSDVWLIDNTVPARSSDRVTK